jgi:hypothetical protein
MAPNNRFLTAFALAAIALVASAADAAVASAASFDEKVDNAAAIILGRCIKTESRFDPTGRWIVTYSTFTVEKSFKGAAGSEITLVTPGGSVGSLHQSTIGVPEFRQGDENVVFVKNNRLGPTVLYFDQGAYEVRRERGERMIAPVPSSLVTVDTQRGLAVAPEGEPRTLQRFESDVRDSIRTMAERKQKMEAMPRPKAPQPPSLRSVLAANKLLLALALLGVALATWHVLRRH